MPPAIPHGARGARTGAAWGVHTLEARTSVNTAKSKADAA